MDRNKYNIWLTYLYEIGIKNIYHLLNKFKSAEDIYLVDKEELFTVNGINTAIVEKISSLKKSVNFDKLFEYMERTNIQFISKEDLSFPEDLANIEDSPIGLFVIGNLPKDSLKVSIIGTRKCSQYGKTVAYNLSKDLANEGITIVSGMALGLDGMAHKGAIDAKGKTIGVLANGVDICYPIENQSIYNGIIENGAIISEYPPKTKPKPWFFPMRNRIISGLSKGVIIIEAPIKSGTLITVNAALDQGKEVMAVPGNITSKLSEGTNMIIREGAHVITEARDVMDVLGIIKNEDDNHIKYEKNINLAPDEKLVYDCISLNPITIDEIVFKTNLKIQNVQYILTKLEFSNNIRKLPGQRYIFI